MPPPILATTLFSMQTINTLLNWQIHTVANLKASLFNLVKVENLITTYIYDRHTAFILHDQINAVGKQNIGY